MQRAHLVEGKVAVVDVPCAHVDLPVRRVRDAIHAELEIAGAAFRGQRAGGRDDLLDWNDGAQDIRARREGDETRLGRNERQERVQLEANRVRVVRVLRELRRVPHLQDCALPRSEPLPRAGVG